MSLAEVEFEPVLSPVSFFRIDISMSTVRYVIILIFIKNVN